MHYVKSLDGIRGFAVSLVVLFHFGFFPAGWVGVQIFFVLSGFLITSILLHEKERSFAEYTARFYWRRSLRILPLYFVYIALTAAFYITTGEPRSISADWPYVITYTTNFARLRPSDTGPAFNHLWSLAVEEQFYLIWPALVYFLSLQMFKRTVIGILIFSPLVRLCLYFVFKGHDADWIGRAIYCLPITQFDAFAAGSAIVLWRLPDLKHAGRGLCIAVVATALCGAIVLAHEHIAYRTAMKWSFGYRMYLAPAWGFVWGYSLLNMLSATVIVCALRRLYVLRFLENRPLVHIGKISYGVYIYHVPVLLLLLLFGGAAQIPKDIFFAIYCMATVTVSEISFRFLETPFLAMKDYWTTSLPRLSEDPATQK